jgi:hypothetical protein
MILIILAWLYYFLLSLCIGAGLLKVFRKRFKNVLAFRYDIFYQFWFGFVMLIGILQVFSLFLPIHRAAFIFVSLLAAIFALINYKIVVNKISWLTRWSLTLRGFLSLLAVFVILLLVSYSANREVQHADTFIYHFNGVKWAKEYPVVPGLANLHGRLGFNSSFFLFAALTDISIYADQSAHVALSFLMVACLVHWFFIISNTSEPMAKRIFCMVTFTYLVFHTVQQIDITSLSTDYPMAVMTLVFCVVLIDKIDQKAILLLPISAAVFSFKLSGMLTITFALLVWLGYIFMLVQSRREKAVAATDKKVLRLSFVLLCFVAGGFIVRNIFVSGWLIYPFPIGNLHLPWSVPKPYVLDMMAWIKSYPKLPGGASPAEISQGQFLFWLPEWFNQFRTTFEYNLLCVAVVVIFWAVFQVRSFGKFIYARLSILMLLLFSAVSVLFWFISAPEVRFGSVYFFMLFAAAIVLLFEGSPYKKILKVLIYVAFIYPLIDNRTPGFYTPIGPKLFTFAYTPPRKLVKVVGSPPGEDPPLYIYMPAEGDACGNSPIPCTPYAGGYLHNHRPIRQRVPGDISKGFLPTK